MSKVRTASGQLIKEDEYIRISHNTTITTSGFLKTASAAATKVVKQIITVKGQASVVEVWNMQLGPPHIFLLFLQMINRPSDGAFRCPTNF